MIISKSRLLATFALLLAASSSAACDFLALDSCLDNGGRWDPKREKCVFEESEKMTQSNRLKINKAFWS